VLLLAACEDNEPPFTYEGDAGTPVPADLGAFVPSVTARIEGGEDRTFLVDTGAPYTILDTTSFPAYPDDTYDLDVEAFDLTFRDYQVVSFDLFGFEPGTEGALDGIIGGDLLSHFAFSLDYKGGRAWLDDPFDPAALPSDLGADPRIDVPFELRGGGTALAPGGGIIRLPPTRVMIQVRFEAQAEPVWALVDSGASAIVLAPSLYAALGDDAGRPRLDGIPVTTAYGVEEAFLTRVWRAQLEGTDGGGAQAGLADVPVLVFPNEQLLQALSNETGVAAQAFIGGMFLRRFWTTFDYQEELLRLAPYTDPSHIPADEFVGVGFEMERVGDDWVVQLVFPGTDAALDGVTAGQVVEEIGGTPVATQDAAFVAALMEPYGLGDEVPIGIRGLAGVEIKQVLVEDLLPSYPAP
jgi:predicted aspartyl protease